MDGEIKAFLDFLAFDRDRAPNTTRRYGELLNRFLAFVRVTLGRAAVAPAEIERGMVEFFVRHGGRPFDGAAAPSTRNVRLAALRGFFGYLVGKGRLLIDPTAGLRPTKVKSRSPGYLTETEFARLLVTVETAATEHYAARDVAVMAVMFHCGLRISEALSLTLPQVNLDALRFHAVVRKGRIVEDVAMNRTAAEAIRRWLLYRKTYRRADETTALFLSDRSRPLSIRALQRNFARYVAAAGLQDRHLTPHSMRHSCATALVGHGVPLSTVSAVLAHQKIETTRIYVRLDGREKREAVALLDPKPPLPRRRTGAEKPEDGFSLTGIPEQPQSGSDLARNGRSTPNSASRFPLCPPRDVASNDGQRAGRLQGVSVMPGRFRPTGGKQAMGGFWISAPRKKSYHTGRMPRDVDIVRQSVEALHQDRRPWVPLDEIKAPLVEFTFQDQGEAEKLGDKLRQHGFDVETHRGVALSASGADFLILAVTTATAAANLISAWLMIKGEPGARVLVEAVKSHLGRRTFNPVFQLEAIAQWMDRKYGRGGWRSDFNLATVKRLSDDTAAIRFQEEISGARHCLLVSEERVLQELSDDLSLEGDS